MYSQNSPIGYMIPAGVGHVLICSQCAFYTRFSGHERALEDRFAPVYHVNVGVYSTACFACGRVAHRGPSTVEIFDGGAFDHWHRLRKSFRSYLYPMFAHLWHVRSPQYSEVT